MTEIPEHLAARMTKPAADEEATSQPIDVDLEASLAFAEALAAVEPVMKTQEADTGKYTYRYADLGDVLDECKRACGLHGLVITQVPTVREGYLAVSMWLLHKNGGQVHFDPLMMALPKEAQAYGSALTYARRYQLMTVFGIAPEDDDGRAATVAAQTQPGRRTEAERMIRESIAQMPEPLRRQFVDDFKREFGMSLTDLPAARHGDALTWAREWQPTAAEPDPDAPMEETPAE
jgi:hypothetical protein